MLIGVLILVLGDDVNDEPRALDSCQWYWKRVDFVAYTAVVVNAVAVDVQI